MQKFVKNDAGRADGYETVSQIEDREGPCLRMKQDVVDDVPVKKTVEKIAGSTRNDEGKPRWANVRSAAVLRHSQSTKTTITSRMLTMNQPCMSDNIENATPRL